MNSFILEWADERGYRIAWGDPPVLDEVRGEMESRFKAGELDQIVFEQYLSKFRYFKGVNLPGVRTVGVVAVPRPAHVVTFLMENGSLEAVVPLTYVGYDETTCRVIEELASKASAAGYGIAPLHAPLKLLAAKLGLVTYGRNNIAYVQGLGSYHQLVGFASDGEFSSMPESQLGATGPALSQQCFNCTACRKACPTGAIGEDRFVLHAGHCLTFWNENQEPWPDWLHPAVHNCLVGCLACQKVCPQNAGLLRLEPVQERFTVEETAAILAGAESDAGAVWDGIKAKLASMGLSDYDRVIGRNLRALAACARSDEEIAN